MNDMDMENAETTLANIAGAIDDGRYRKGMWQKFLRDAESLDFQSRHAIAGQVSEVSRKVHGLNGYLRAPFGVALALEVMLFAAGVWLLWWGTLISMLVGVTALALTLQPLIKVMAGLLLGVRYDYVFLWNVEPRFKMRYGSYLQLPAGRRVAFHAAGSLGTPLAMFIGFLCFWPLSRELGWACLVFTVGAAAMQIGAFVAEWMGVTKIAGLRLANLTSPATAAFELKRMLN